MSKIFMRPKYFQYSIKHVGLKDLSPNKPDVIKMDFEMAGVMEAVTKELEP